MQEPNELGRTRSIQHSRIQSPRVELIRVPTASRRAEAIAHELSSLLAARRDDGKTVERHVGSQELLEVRSQRGKRRRLEPVLVEVELDPPTAGEAGAVFANDSRVVRCAANLEEAIDMVASRPVWRIAHVVEPEHRAQRLGSSLSDRYVIQREKRDEPPELRFAQRRGHRCRWGNQRGNPPKRPLARQIEIVGLRGASPNRQRLGKIPVNRPRLERLAFGAAREALAGQEISDSLGLVFASGYGGLAATEGFLRSVASRHARFAAGDPIRLGFRPRTPSK